MALAAVLMGATTDLDRDENLAFLPTYACRLDDGSWRFTVRGWVYELAVAPVAIEKICERLNIELAELVGDKEAAANWRELLAKRAAPFLVDNERGQRIEIRVGERTHMVGPSARNGRFASPVRLSDEEVSRLRETGAIGADGWMRFVAETKPGDGRVIHGEVQFIEACGRSVISDIDDTIKITEVADKKRLLCNTFLLPFRPVEGMAELYRRWAEGGATVFHYVSSSPYQLYEPLREFIDAERFPAGSYFLKSFSRHDGTLMASYRARDSFKMESISPILADFPQRRFVLVGDSGQADPEIYGELARRNPMQVEHVYIRNVTGEGPSAARYGEAFRGVSPGKWTIFDDAREIGAGWVASTAGGGVAGASSTVTASDSGAGATSTRPLEGSR